MRSVMLIGAPCAGKSTVSRLLSKILGCPCVSLDALAARLMADLGMDSGRAESLYLQQRYDEWETYLRPYRHTALQAVVEAFPQNCVIDVGAGFVLGNLGVQLSEVLRRLHIVHLCIHQDACINAIQLRRRLGRRIAKTGQPALRKEVDHFVAASLKSLAVYDELASIKLVTCGERPCASAGRLAWILRNRFPD